MVVVVSDGDSDNNVPRRSMLAFLEEAWAVSGGPDLLGLTRHDPKDKYKGECPAYLSSTMQPSSRHIHTCMHDGCLLCAVPLSPTSKQLCHHPLGAKDWAQHNGQRRFLRAMAPWLGPPSHLLLRMRLPIAIILVSTLLINVYEVVTQRDIDPG